MQTINPTFIKKSAAKILLFFGMTKFFIKNSIFFGFFHKLLHICKKSCTFAANFANIL